MTEPSPMPEAVIDALFAFKAKRCTCWDDVPSHPRCEALTYPGAHELLRTIKWDGLNGCYFFYAAGMFVGVETDGYIHT